MHLVQFGHEICVRALKLMGSRANFIYHRLLDTMDRSFIEKVVFQALQQK